MDNQLREIETLPDRPDNGDAARNRVIFMAQAMAMTAGIPDMDWPDEAIDSGGVLNRVDLLAALRARGVALEEVWLRGGGQAWRVVRMPSLELPLTKTIAAKLVAVVRAGLDVEQARALSPEVRQERARNIAAAILGNFNVEEVS
jgi:hypothetical protein